MRNWKNSGYRESSNIIRFSILKSYCSKILLFIVVDKTEKKMVFFDAKRPLKWIKYYCVEANKRFYVGFTLILTYFWSLFSLIMEY